MKYLPITPELEKVINNLDVPATTKLFRELTQNTNSKDTLLLNQANGLVSIVASLQLVNGGKL